MEQVVHIKDTITWKVHPLTENRLRSVIVVLFLIFVIVIVQLNFQNKFITFLSLLLLLGSLLRYFLPTEYQLDKNGIQFRFLGKSKIRNWSEFHCFYMCKHGIQFSTFDRPNRLDSFRGLYIILKEDHTNIVDYIRIYLHETK